MSGLSPEVLAAAREEMVTVELSMLEAHVLATAAKAMVDLEHLAAEIGTDFDALMCKGDLLAGAAKLREAVGS